MPDNSIEIRKVDSFQEFDYDIELTEDERRILNKIILILMFSTVQILKILKTFNSYRRIFKINIIVFTNVRFVVEEFALDLY